MGRTLQIFFISVIAFVIYVNTLHNGFVYDDKGIILDNKSINNIINLPKLFTNEYFVVSKEASYRPFVTLTYFTDYAIFGLKPWGYHLTNILLHAFNGILFYVFAALLLNKGSVGYQRSYYHFFLTLTYVFHPVLTEAVNAISYREDLLVFLFYIATLNLYISLTTKSLSDSKPSVLRTYLLSCLTFSLALLSKEMALTLPLIICCYEWIYSENRKGGLKSNLLNRYNLGYIAIALVYVYFRFYYFENPIRKVFYIPAKNERLLTIPLLFLSYLKLLLIPVSLSSEYVFLKVSSVFSPFFVIPFFVIAFFLVLAFKIKKINKETAFGIFFFIITLIPVYHVIPIPNFMAERHLYLPSAGFIIAIGSVMQPMFYRISNEEIGRQRPLLITFIFMTCIFFFIIANRNAVWKDDYSFWSDAVMKMPKSYRARYSLGVCYAGQGKFNEAIQQFQMALKLSPGDMDAHVELVIAHYDLGGSYEKQGKFDQAIQQYQIALKLEPSLTQARDNLKSIYAKGSKKQNGI